ncbi:MAG: retroviral-like aspartic protease family protein [Magnetococcales bacterium]|nr:retroviral-like aspartic protease family protein [Magnetococcales bacterium]
MRSRIGPFAMTLCALLNTAPVGATEEIIQCSDGKGGDPALFRKGECQPVGDPTVPPGQRSHGSAASSRGADPELDDLRKNLDEIKKKMTDLGEVGRYEIHPVGKDETIRTATPGPWKVSQILVPTAGEDVRGFVKSALINGYRYRLGEQVDGGVVREIARDRVIMAHDGRETVVPFDKLTHATLFGRVGVVPLKRDPSGIYLINVRINNNQEIEAVLDTGSSNLALPEDVVSWLVRSGTLKKSDLIGTAKSRIADGSMIDSTVFKVASLRVGDMELKDVEGFSLPPQKKDKESEKEKNKDKDKDKDKEKSPDISPKAGDPDSSGSGKEDLLDISALNRPLFGIQDLKRLGRWRIDHLSDQLIVER